MDVSLRRTAVAELLGTFAIVYVSAGAVIVNYLASTGVQPGLSPLLGQQPGLVGIAVAQGLMVAAMLAVTIQLSGGFLNPAITLMLWVFNQLDNRRTSVFLCAQLAGGLLAGGCLQLTFEYTVLREAHAGAPHLSRLAFPALDTGSIIAGTSIEVILTFFLVFAIFGSLRPGVDRRSAALPAGLVLTAGTIVAGPLTGAAANPARWFGLTPWEQLLGNANPWTDTFVYLAGPVLGALAAGWVVFRWLTGDDAGETPAAPSVVKQPTSAPKRK